MDACIALYRALRATHKDPLQRRETAEQAAVGYLRRIAADSAPR
jgi:hypothetical protein